MKNIMSLILVCVFIFGINSCKEDLISTIGNPEELEALKSSDIYEKEKKEYDNNMRKIAKSLAKSLKNKELRKLIKEEAMLQVDGDYDIIWKDFKYNKVKTDNGEKDLEELIAENIEEKEKTKEKKKEELENFGNKYKRLQIAVPVHCENWDVEGFEPVVVFVTSDYSEEQKEIEAYDSKGKIIRLSNKIEPDFPVIVVNMNERSDEDGNIEDTYMVLKRAMIPIDNDPLEYVPPVPTNLQASTSSTGIHLTWSFTGKTTDNIIIQKNSGSGYSTIRTVTGNHRDFLDVDGLIFGNTYYYRLEAYSTNLRTSNFGAAISVTYVVRPGTPKDFEVVNSWSNQMDLAWNNNISYSYGTTIKVERWIHGASTAWEQVVTLAPTENSYKDLNLKYKNYPLNRYQYRIYYDSGTKGKSDAVFDVDYNAQRTPSQPIYITHIKVKDLDKIESWVYGAPEFDYTVATMNTSSDTPVKIKNKVRYEPEKRITDKNVVYNDNVPILGNWDKEFSQSVMSINLVEYDGEWFSGDFTVEAGVKKVTKSKVLGDITIGAGGKVEMEFKNSDKNLGTEYIYYWEDTEITRHYGYDVMVRFSNKKNTEEWKTIWE